VHLKAGVEQGGTAGKKMIAIAHAMSLPKPSAEPHEAHGFTASMRTGRAGTRPLNLEVSSMEYERNRNAVLKSLPASYGQLGALSKVFPSCLLSRSRSPTPDGQPLALLEITETREYAVVKRRECII
jgi:hypothetical protein